MAPGAAFAMSAAPAGGGRIAVIALTAGGRGLAARLAAALPGELIDPRPSGVLAAVALAWPRVDGLVLIMACGVAVRAIAPLLRDKRLDPGVVVLDEAGRFCVSLLAGHLGGANDLARRLAGLTGGQAVITTASDTLGHTALDLWARRNALFLAQGSLTAVSARLVSRGELKVFIDLPGELPEDFRVVAEAEGAELVVSNRRREPGAALARLSPRNLALGIGCNRGVSGQRIEEAALAVCEENGLDFQAVDGLGSIDIKREEPGLWQFAARHGLEITFYQAGELNSVPGLSPSPAARAATGAQGVAEPAALLLAGDGGQLIVRKYKCKDVTIAIAARPVRLTANYPWSAPGQAATST